MKTMGEKGDEEQLLSFLNAVLKRSSTDKLASVKIIADKTFVDFEFIPEERIADVHTTFHLWEDDHKHFMLTDALEIHFIDMSKFRKLARKDRELSVTLVDDFF